MVSVSKTYIYLVLLCLLPKKLEAKSVKDYAEPSASPLVLPHDIT